MSSSSSSSPPPSPPSLKTKRRRKATASCFNLEKRANLSEVQGSEFRREINAPVDFIDVCPISKTLRTLSQVPSKVSLNYGRFGVWHGLACMDQASPSLGAGRSILQMRALQDAARNEPPLPPLLFPDSVLLLPYPYPERAYSTAPALTFHRSEPNESVNPATATRPSS